MGRLKSPWLPVDQRKVQAPVAKEQRDKPPFWPP